MGRISELSVREQLHATPEQAMVCDPPSGWMYGFPKIVPRELEEASDEDWTNWLVANGYPAKDTELALRHMRMWFA